MKKVERTKSDILVSILWIILIFFIGKISNTNIKSDGYIIFLMLLLHSVRMYMILRYHELEILSGILSFDKSYFSFKRIKITIKKIEYIIEKRREVNGISYPTSTFIIICNDGTQYEYYPAIWRENERLKSIRNFFSSIKPIEYSDEVLKYSIWGI